MNTKPIAGAAKYFAGRTGDGRFAVFMKEENEGMQDTASEVQSCKSAEAALLAAEKWQKKENAVVTKEAARVARLAKKAK